MTFQEPSQHPVPKSQSMLSRYEPIVVGLIAAVIFAVLSLVAAAQDELSVSEAITHFGTIAMMIAGGSWARRRVVSVASYDAKIAETKTQAQQFERAAIDAERAADVELSLIHI